MGQAYAKVLQDERAREVGKELHSFLDSNSEDEDEDEEEVELLYLSLYTTFTT